jgi:hypothetical protein
MVMSFGYASFLCPFTIPQPWHMFTKLQGDPPIKLVASNTKKTEHKMALKNKFLFCLT